MPQNVLEEVLQWCNEKLRSQHTAVMALDGLQNLLRHNDVRVKFFEDDGLNRYVFIFKSRIGNSFLFILLSILD